MKAHVINLKHRPERWLSCVKEFEKIGLMPERFIGTHMRPGWHGCRESHLRFLRNVSREDIFMLAEDDILFMPDALENMNKAMRQLPEDWDMLYLGATLNKAIERHSENLYRLKSGYTTHAIIYNPARVIDFIINYNPIRKIDVFFADILQEQFNCYVTYPIVATQMPGYSDITNCFNDYSAIQKQFNQFT